LSPRFVVLSFTHFLFIDRILNSDPLGEVSAYRGARFSYPVSSMNFKLTQFFILLPLHCNSQFFRQSFAFISLVLNSTGCVLKFCLPFTQFCYQLRDTPIYRMNLQLCYRSRCGNFSYTCVAHVLMQRCMHLATLRYKLLWKLLTCGISE
jgi:hypothetical protein